MHRTLIEVIIVLSPIRLLSILSVALCAVLSAAARPAEAQESGSIFELMEVEGQLTVGAEAHGTLSTADVRASDDTYMEAWSLEGRAGESVTIDLISEDFDAFLYVVGPGLGQTLSDDDGGGACHARITFTFLENGTFRVVASSVSESIGTYMLRASDMPGQMAGYACGAMNPAVLTALPTDGRRRLKLGDVESGALTAESPTVDEGRKAEAWTLEARAGESATITLESDAFDAYLYITGPGLGDVLTDDDGAGDLNSQLTVTFPQSATYLVVASQVNGGVSGAYTLKVEEPLDLNTLPTDGRTAEVGGTMEGRLSLDDPLIVDGRRGQAWALRGRAGERYTIDLMSDDFDCYLYFVGPGIAEPMTDDDGAGDLDSRIVVTLTEDGTYRIIASSLSASDVGSYRLRVLGGDR